MRIEAGAAGSGHEQGPLLIPSGRPYGLVIPIGKLGFPGGLYRFLTKGLKHVEGKQWRSIRDIFSEQEDAIAIGHVGQRRQSARDLF